MNEALTYPNGVAMRTVWEPGSNLPERIDYARTAAAAPFQSHTYAYDALARPVSRTDLRESTAHPEETRAFAHNTRSELIGETGGLGGNCAYNFDAIGNRKESQEGPNERLYEANKLNQYEEILGESTSFIPDHDADGNQTRVQTSTGTWRVTYDANNRPVRFESEDKTTVVTCGYDSMGRRYEKKIIKNGQVTCHARYCYQGYLQIAEIDLTGGTPQLVRTHVWDPTEPTATRILATHEITTDERLYHHHDALKNVMSLSDAAGTIRANYGYAPFGGTTLKEGDKAQQNAYRFSSEYADEELGLIYYNYRHLNPLDGRWISRDPIGEKGAFSYIIESYQLYGFVENSPLSLYDDRGMSSKQVSGGASLSTGHTSGENNHFKELADAGAGGKGKGKTTPLGQELLAYMEELNKDNCCIKKLTIVGHGWTNRATPMGGSPGIPGVGSENGLYIDGYSGVEGADMNDLNFKILSEKIQFCLKCQIQIYACRVSKAFGEALGNATGCQVTFAQGSCRTRGPSKPWTSGPGEENDNRNQNNGFFRSNGGKPSVPIGNKYVPF